MICCDMCQIASETRVIKWKGPRRYQGTIHVCRLCYLMEQELKDEAKSPWSNLPLSGNIAT